MSTLPNQADVDELRGLLDLMADFSDNDQRARYLLSSNWMRDRDAAAARMQAASVSADPYAGDEMTDDLTTWAMATPEQRSKAFNTLIACVTADAYHRHDFYLAIQLRKIRAERDEVQS